MEPILNINHDRSIFAIAGWVFAFIMTVGFFFVSAPPIPEKDGCALYKVDKRPVTAYVLKPPPPEIRYEACPQTTQKLDPFEPSPIVQRPSETDSQKLSDEKTDNIKQDDPEPRPRRRHRRYRRYWR